jgi:hypothetical protein
MKIPSIVLSPEQGYLITIGLVIIIALILALISKMLFSLKDYIMLRVYYNRYQKSKQNALIIIRDSGVLAKMWIRLTRGNKLFD